MSTATVISINTLLNKAAVTLNTMLTEKDRQDATAKTYHALKEKIQKYSPVADYQHHTLHYVMKGMAYLPAPLLETLISRLQGPSATQYAHADAHLRLILAVNSALKTPLQSTPMREMRKRFATDAVAMQAPKVWQQASDTVFSHIKRFRQKGVRAVQWQDQKIANADDGEMKIRCYQARSQPASLVSTVSRVKTTEHNPDKTVMLFFHGGGFCIGDIDTHHEFCHAVCEQTGWPVVSVDYRLAPEHPAPTALRDCITAYAWLAKHCQSLGALPSRIVLAGDSAGGGLSTLIAQQIVAPTAEAWQDLDAAGQKMFDTLKQLPAPLAQLPLYPVTDIETDYPSWELYGEGLLLDRADVAVFDAACLDSSPLPRQHTLHSPIQGDNRQVCPTYVVISELDVLRDEALAYAQQLKAHGVLVETYTVLGAPHGFIHLMSVHQGMGQETLTIIEHFTHFVQDLIRSQVPLAA